MKMSISPDLAQDTINFLMRVSTTGLDEANYLLAVAEAIKAAGEEGARVMAKANAAAKEAETEDTTS